MGVIVVTRNFGSENVPQDVRRRRRQVYDAMRRLGAPVLVKHKFNDDDVLSGVAIESPAIDPDYQQSSSADPFSYGVGFCSLELSTNEWAPSDYSQIIVSNSSPGPGYVQVPKYRGFGPGYLCYVIEPDAAMDVFKQVPSGALIKVQTATGQAPWLPQMGTDDLFINVKLDNQGNIISTQERYLLKDVTPISIRGLDRRGRREYTEGGGNRHVLNQTYQMDLLPSSHPYQNVETDR